MAFACSVVESTHCFHRISFSTRSSVLKQTETSTYTWSCIDWQPSESYALVVGEGKTREEAIKELQDEEL